MRVSLYTGFLMVFSTIIIPKHTNAFKYNNSYWKNLGGSENIIFSTEEGNANKEIKSCSWTIKTAARNESFELNEFNLCYKERYCLSGKGLKDGDCGLRIDNVRNEDFGIWECKMTLKKTGRIYNHSTQLKLITLPLILEEQDDDGVFIVPVKPDVNETEVSVKFSGNQNTFFCWIVTDSSRGYHKTVILSQPNTTERVDYDYENDKYSISRRKSSISSDILESILLINNFSPDDLERSYILNVTNEYGSRILHVNLVNEIQDTDTSNWLLILGIVLFVIFFIVTVTLILCALKKKRMLCFRRKFNYQVNSQPRISSTAYTAASTVDDASEVQVREDNSAVTFSSGK